MLTAVAAAVFVVGLVVGAGDSVLGAGGSVLGLVDSVTGSVFVVVTVVDGLVVTGAGVSVAFVVVVVVVVGLVVAGSVVVIPAAVVVVKRVVVVVVVVEVVVMVVVVAYKGSQSKLVYDVSCQATLKNTATLIKKCFRNLMTFLAHETRNIKKFEAMQLEEIKIRLTS